MPTRQTTVKRIGRGRRSAKESHQKLKEKLYAAAREKRQADLKLKKITKQARAAGLVAEVESIADNPDFKLRRQHLHIYPYGLDNPDHNHLVIEFDGELSYSCIAELREKVTNGKVTFDRDVYEGGRWRIIYHEEDDSLYAAAD